MTGAQRQAVVDSDSKVIAALRRSGDEIVLAREVKHWALFSSQDGAKMYIDWLADQEFGQIELAQAEDPDGLDWRVTYTHEVVPRLEVITTHTVPATKHAELLGGNYDGWETSVESG